MSKQPISPEVIAETVARIPEGFVHRSQLTRRYHSKIRVDSAIADAVEQQKVGRTGGYIYDLHRLDAEKTRKLAAWTRPELPPALQDGKFYIPTIYERIKNRARQFSLSTNPAYARIFELIDQNNGYLTPELQAAHPSDQALIDNLIHAGGLDITEGYVYDPLQLSHETILEVIRRADVERQTTAAKIIEEEQVPDDDAWNEALSLSGSQLRPNAKDVGSIKQRVLAHTYNIVDAAKRLDLHENTIEMALHEGRLSSFADPEGKIRIPASEVEAAAADVDYLEQIAALEVLRVRDISIVIGANYPNTRKRLVRAGISRGEPRWGDVRGRWGMPSTLREFREVLNTRLAAWRAERQAIIAEQERLLQEQRRRIQEERDKERRRRQELRARLVAAFPTWQHEGRADQRITIHVGPPNSGKTHHALQALSAANSGWYLAPLRLLAFEIFDRLNRMGVYCNLLTGEEYIPIPGATITAATIEMFDPRNSGDVVIIDEAQMLADPDRGWAWTRAIMEAQSPEIRVICPPTAHRLIEQMATAAAIPVEVVKHDRLAPIKVADKHWTLENLPPRTILVAFSRQSVLHLKNELERLKRTVSVIYGNLPPEVRRKQADRFATGQTDICVATDAVGMGLNLPADYVCFFELQKFDGKKVRVLTSSEVQQIGGRAGRYGLSTIGEVGATNKRDLRLVKQLFYAPQAVLSHARVAPTVDDLEMIPGNLAEKLDQWASLQSVPDSLKSAIKTADLSERIELARMLTDEEVDYLGLGTTMRLINAPTRQSTRGYWYKCAQAILHRQPMPLPPEAPLEVSNSQDLEAMETSVSCADIYLWLACRPEFSAYAPDAEQVRHDRTEWSERIDAGLLRRLDMARRCSNCGKPLSVNFRYSMCNDCYYGRFEPEDYEVIEPN